MKRIERYPFQSQEKCLQQIPLVLVRKRAPTQLVGGNPTLNADGKVRRLTLAPTPEVTLSLLEPGPVNQSIAKIFLKQGNAEFLELKDLDQFARCTGLSVGAPSRCNLM